MSITSRAVSRNGAAGLAEIVAALRPHALTAAFLAAVVVCGFLFGGIAAGELNPADNTVVGEALARLLQAVQQAQLAPPGQLWWQRWIGDLQLLALLWLFGITVLGLPFVVIAVFLRAFSVGFAAAFTVIQYGWKGLLVAALTIFLHQIVSMSVLLIAGVTAIRFSAGVLRRTEPHRRMLGSFVRYTAWFAVYSGGLMVGAWIQAYIAPAVLRGVLLGG